MKDVTRILEDFERLDKMFLIPVALLSAIGIVLVYSCTANEAKHLMDAYWFRQILHFVAGAIIAFLVTRISPRTLHALAYPGYVVMLVLLVYVAMGHGYSTKGAGRWIDLGFFRFQPSEFAKIAYLLAAARLLSGMKVTLFRLSSFVLPGLLFLLPFVLVLKQPDLHTALVFFAITLVFFYWSGMTIAEIFLLLSPLFSVVATVSSFAWAGLLIAVVLVAWRIRLSLVIRSLLVVVFIGAGFASVMVWNRVLEDHQRSRILTFIDPMKDPKGDGYQVIQSKVAIGSGGLMGKGFGNGSQTNLAFLPEEHTDFIFSVLGEQFGFVGGVVVFLLYAMVILRAASICRLHGNPFVNLVAVGAATILAFHVVVNVAMTLGMMPVTGIPLPFLSYGGSFVLTCMILVGLILNMRLKGRVV